MKENLRIVFMGTPDFAAHFLEFLHLSKHEILAVVTQPDRPFGRGKVLTAPPVKKLALELGYPVLQPTDLKDLGFINQLKALEADIFVVVAFSILPSALLSVSKQGAINIHGSLLPKYRGAAPVQWAIANGESKTGVTVFLLDQKMDHGPILEQREVYIDMEDTTASVLQKMIEPASEALEAALETIRLGASEISPQNHQDASAAPKLKKEDGLLDFNKTALDLHNQIRAFDPWPGAFSSLLTKKVYLRKTKVAPEAANSLPKILKPAEILILEDRFLVGTFEGVLEVLEIQVEGRKAMPVSQYIHGLQQKEALYFEF